MSISIDQLFNSARTHSAWQDRPVPAEVMQTLYQMTVMGPTSANCLPLRIAYVASPQAKQQLVPLMAEGNREKTRLAPLTAILAYDLLFHEKLPKLYPHQPDAPSWFNSSPESAREAALRNGSLQGGYFIMAARALGLDCGPMGGFDAPAVAQEFFPGMPYEVNFICNLGYGDASQLLPRLPRLSFDEACIVE
ncbi:malonic semialdehyde reductase [Pusillimonas sp. MFBS29]|uniref:malonic semialdehyde reductase n=1 Tax=Pusillimonas sp. MFBS29 TaxID=2886690 RepID=UPI001D102159|nr:malonic semialdehyde reductase [Pusillimonas sp. MFBS29]MCC2597105.1 malonic semialdehyde reductase [Pusillimonas sp. MFBS29]